MTPSTTHIAAEAQWLRDQVAAHALASELGCEVAPHPELAGVIEAFTPAPGVWLLSGQPDEIRAEWRAAWLRVWLTSYLGNPQDRPAAAADGRGTESRGAGRVRGRAESGQGA